MPAESPSKETRVRRLELLFIAVLCVVLLASLGVLWLQQKGFFAGAPVVEHSPEQRLEKPIELNTAAWWELRQVPGVSEAVAKRIVEEREKRGGFRTFDELKGVYGVGEKRLEQIRAKVRLVPPAADRGKKR